MHLRDPRLAARRRALLDALARGSTGVGAAGTAADRAIDEAYEWIAAYPSDAEVLDALAAALEREPDDESGPRQRAKGQP